MRPTNALRYAHSFAAVCAESSTDVTSALKEDFVRLKALVWLLLLCAVVATAKDVKVRKAWERTFPNTSFNIFPDNLGNIAAVGRDTNGSFVMLLNDKGRTVAWAPIPISGVAGGVADQAGRIFVSGTVSGFEAVHSTAFAPSLSTLLWTHTNNIGFGQPIPGRSVTVGPTAPDEMGGVFVFGDWVEGMFISHFNSVGSDARGIYDGLLTPYRAAGAIARAPNGDTLFVGNAVAFRDQWVTVIKWNPTTATYAIYGRNSPGVNGYALANAAACDSQGNLIITGSHYERPGPGATRFGRCSTTKLDSNGNLVWEVFHGPSVNATYGIGHTGLGVAIDKSDNIIMTGTAGTVKYSPSGQVLWDTPETGTTLHLDRFGNVLLSQAVTREDGISESEITKLNADGTLRWQIRFHDGSTSGSWPAGLMLDDQGNVYFAATSSEGSTIVKFVEHGAGKDRQKE